MPFDWSQYLTLAEELALRTTEEAAMRSAISRAYYAAFNLARIRAEKNLGSIPRPPNLGSHEALWTVFRRHTDRRCRAIGVNGDRLRDNRGRADYRDAIANVQSEMAAALLKARVIVQSLGVLPANLP